MIFHTSMLTAALNSNCRARSSNSLKHASLGNVLQVLVNEAVLVRGATVLPHKELTESVRTAQIII